MLKKNFETLVQETVQHVSLHQNSTDRKYPQFTICNSSLFQEEFWNFRTRDCSYVSCIKTRPTENIHQFTTCTSKFCLVQFWHCSIKGTHKHVLDICVKLHQQNISIETIYPSSFYYEIQLSTQNIVPSTCYNTKHLILMVVIIAWHPWSYPFKNIFQNILQDNALS